MIERVHRRTVLLLTVVALVALLQGCDRGGPEPPPRVVIFGVDGATWNVLTPMIEAGELPNIAELIRDGSSGVLRCGTPIQSPQMWTSIATGMVPEKHGILHFMAEIPGTDRSVPVTSNLRKVKAFWNILSDVGVSVGIVGWWPSWPAEEVNGFMIAQRAWPVKWSKHGIPYGVLRDRNGRLIVDDFLGRTYPEELYEEFEPFIVTENDLTDQDLRRFFSDPRYTNPLREIQATWAYAKDRSFAEGGLHFLTEYEPDVFAVYFQGTDVVSHYFWGYQIEEGFRPPPGDDQMYGGVVRGYYAYIDEVIGRYLTLLPDDVAVIIVSDHGFETKVDLKERWERGESIRTLEGHRPEPWDHAKSGVYIVKGRGIRAGYEGPEASVVDVTPTLLAYLGVPVGEDMDGRPIEAIMEDRLLRDRPIQYVATHESGEARGDEAPLESPMDEGLTEKLRSLGYIE